MMSYAPDVVSSAVMIVDKNSVTFVRGIRPSSGG